MPYINKQRRQHWDKVIEDLRLLINNGTSAGDFNYILTRIVTSMPFHSYDYINGVIGVLECCKLELYRRIAVPYEEKKKEENGDVYGN